MIARGRSGRSSGRCWRLGAAPLVALGVLFVALTLAGTPIVFMLAIVGIVALFSPSFLGLTFYPNTDAILPFSVPSSRWASRAAASSS